MSSQAQAAPSGKVRRPINMNHYVTKKTAAQSMLDIAQLKTVLYVGPGYRFYIALIMLQVAVLHLL